MENKDPAKKRLETYEQLANALAQNMIYNSLRGVDLIDGYDKDNPDVSPPNVFTKILKKYPLNKFQYPSRNIVVVGAGASKNACKATPTGVEAAGRLKRKYSKLLTISGLLSQDSGNGKAEQKRDLLEDELTRLNDIYRLPKDEFETILLAISKFVPDALLEDLKKLYEHEFYPNLTYEILAHMFKHRFVDAIINFNFDEILDRTIKDELNETSYLRIISDGDYKDLYSLLLKENLKLPLYIKPHGTISAPSTLKFTDEDYFRIAKGITELLDFLLSGSISAQKEDINKQTKINLIIVGFAMNSMEFNKILFNQFHSKHIRLFFFDRTPEFIEKRLRAGMVDKDSMAWTSTLDESIEMNSPTYVDITKKDEKKYGNLLAPCLDDNNPMLSDKIQMVRKSLNDHFFFLWMKTASLFKPQFRPRSISRHILISSFFDENTSFHHRAVRILYLMQRIYLELGMSIMKYRGFVNVSQMSEDRVGKYFNEYQRQAKKHKARIKKIFPKFEINSMMDFCKELGLDESGYGKYVLMKKLVNKPSGKISEEAVTAFNQVWKDLNNNNKLDRINQLENTLLEKKLPIKPKDRFGRRLKRHRKILKQTFLKLYKGDQAGVSPKYDGIYDNRFKDPKIISTYFGFQYTTHHLIVGNKTQSNDVVIFAVAESGEWLVNIYDSYGEDLKNRIKKVVMVTATSYENQESNSGASIHKILSSKIIKKVEKEELWWTEHNRHMTIVFPTKKLDEALKNNKKTSRKKKVTVGNLKFIDKLNASVMYFERRLNNAQILPVLLHDKEDVQTCLESFVAYWLKAKGSTKNETIHITRKEVMEFDLLKLLNYK